jgi:hypothetical protein
VKDWPTYEQAGELWDAHVANWTGEDTPLSERWALWGELRSDTPRLWQLALGLGYRQGWEAALVPKVEMPNVSSGPERWAVPQVPAPPELSKEDLQACADEAREWRKQMDPKAAEPQRIDTGMWQDPGWDEVRKGFEEYRSERAMQNPKQLLNQRCSATHLYRDTPVRCALKQGHQGDHEFNLPDLVAAEEAARKAADPKECYQRGLWEGQAKGWLEEREAVVRWLNERAKANAEKAKRQARSLGAFDTFQERAETLSAAAIHIADGRHLAPPEPTREQAEERCIEDMARAAQKLCGGIARFEEVREAWTNGARASWASLPWSARKSAIEAMLAELRGEGRK